MISGFNPNSRVTAKAWEAKASFNSIKSISFNVNPAWDKAFGIAFTGPIPMILGSTPAEAKLTKRAIGSRFNSLTISSLITKTKAAPSLIWEEFPAVTEPSAAKTGFKFAKASTVVPNLGPSSFATTYDFVSFLPFSFTNVCSILIGTIWLSNFPSACAFKAFICDSNANLSWSSLEMLNCFATASAVKPIPQ